MATKDQRKWSTRGREVFGQSLAYNNRSGVGGWGGGGVGLRKLCPLIQLCFLYDNGHTRAHRSRREREQERECAHAGALAASIYIEAATTYTQSCSLCVYYHKILVL